MADAYQLGAFAIAVLGILALVWIVRIPADEKPKPIPPPTPCPPPPSLHTIDPADETTKIEWPEREPEP